ncbi:MAG TPA: spore germination protein GerW family protein [Daejeonella sp.]|nr:spore germination protein GerW family protein [Daejeonella sp.]
MALNYDEAVKRITDFLANEAKTETVIGQSFQLGEFTCVPVIKFGIGIGYGGGEGHGDNPAKGKGEGTGIGGGGGLGVAPIGFLVTRADKISFISSHTSSGLGAAFEKVPELFEKLMDKQKQRAENGQ